MKDKLSKWKNHKFKDVYLLGAGASLAYGYPLGQMLKEEILKLASGNDQIFNKLKENIDKDKRSDIQHELGEFSKEFDKFIEAFKKSGAETIDSFVHRNPSLLGISRFLVGYVLTIRARAARNIIDGAVSKMNDHAEPWIHNYLNKRVGTNYQQYINEPDCFISFNYDLSLEDHFLNYFSSQQIDGYVSGNSKRIVFNELPVFHIYGQLSGLKPVLSSLSRNEPPDVENLLQVSSEINFIDRKDNVDYLAIREIIQKAERLIVLGYGYDPDNNHILFGGLKGLQNNFLTLKVLSTCKGFSESEVEEFKRLRFEENLVKSHDVLRKYETEMFDKDCNQFLLDHILIRKFFNDKQKNE